MQYKKTQPLEHGDLPDLTEKQREFARHILAGKTASDAYRAAYDCSNMVPNTIWCEASRTRALPHVAQWLSEARQAHLGTAVLTRDQHLQELERLREIAIRSGNIGAAVLAETTRGKVAGHHIERIQDVTSQTDVMQTLRDIAALGPEGEAAAAAIAAAEKIPWKADEGATKH